MKFLLKLVSYIYRLVITIRHWLFDIGLLKSVKFDPCDFNIAAARS